MPHQCTTCGHAFEDGSKDMLGGCPECGGTKFQFYPEGTDVPADPQDGQDSEPPERRDHSRAGTIGRAANAVRGFVDDGRPPGANPDSDATWPSEAPEECADDGTPAADSDIIDADERRDRVTFEDADAAADREDVVAEGDFAGGVLGPDPDGPQSVSAEGGESPDVTESADAPPGSEGPAEVVSKPAGEELDMAELREQLNDQFESIKVLEPGQYELNLMELYDREEYIIALQENGRYVIQVPENWLGTRVEE